MQIDPERIAEWTRIAEEAQKAGDLPAWRTAEDLARMSIAAAHRDATTHAEFAVLRNGIYYPCATYAECLTAAVADPEARMVRRQVSDWQWTS